MSVNKTLLGLLIVAAGLVYYLYKNDANTTNNDIFIASLNSNESAISTLNRVLVSQGNQQFDMRKDEGAWYLNGGFYVRMDSLFQWVQALKNARLIEAKTANPDNFAALSLTEDDLRVRLYQDEQLLTDVILGETGVMADARFVRFYQENQSWLASGLNGLSSGQEVWQLTMILDVPENRVQAIELTSGDSLRAIKNSGTGHWQQSGEHNNSNSLDQEKIQKLAATLSGFRIQQAMPSSLLTEQPLQTLVFGLDQGRQITIAVYQVDDNTFIKVKDSQQPGLYDDWQFTVPDYKLTTLLIDQAAILNTQTDGSNSMGPSLKSEAMDNNQSQPST